MKTNDNEITCETLDQLSSIAVARRRALLRGVGKGVAVLAATAPIQTLAGQSLLTFDGNHQCSVSGQHSGVHSATPTNTPLCGGYSPNYWGQRATDGTSPLQTWPTNYQATFNSIFTQSSITATLFQIMDNGGQQYLNSDERHWLGAYLNALSGSFNFPYSGADVIAYYNQGSGSPAYEAALTFFKNYMETHTS